MNFNKLVQRIPKFNTLQLCNSREDLYSKGIEMCLLSINDLVAAEARYHNACRSNFENAVPKYQSRGRPTSKKLEAFEAMCKILEDEIEFCTILRSYG